MKLSRRLFLLSPLALAYKPSWGALSFPLPQGHFVPAKMPMHPVYPRPDSETQAHARHRWAHPDFRYEIPIGVQGGAWPFKYEILSGPTGATIGQYYGDPDYGILKWTPADGDSGTKTFAIRVTDQELNSVDLTWTTTIDISAFIFLDAVNGSDTTGDGSIENPYATPISWYGAGKDTASYPDKIIVYRSGSYVLQRYDSTANWVSVKNGVKPNQHIKFPDETPFLDCSVTGFITDNPTDLFVSVDMGNTAPQQNADAKCIWVTGSGDRITLLGNLSDLGRGTVGNDNPAGYMFSSTRRNNIFIQGNLSGSNIAPMFDIYGGKYVLCENITLGGMFSWSQVLFIKSDSSDVTIRNVLCTASFDCNYGVINLMGQEQNYRQERIEVCWCWIDGHGGNHQEAIITYWVSGSYPTPMRDIWIYRNTLKGKISGLDNNQTINVERNVIVSDSTPYVLSSDTQRIITNTSNINGSTSDNIIDASGRLVGSFRTQYLGISGHEITSDYKPIPKTPRQINLK